MRRTLSFVFLSAALGAMGSAWADTAVVKVYSLDVKERIQTLELIDVSAEKAVSDEAEAPDATLQAILNEVEVLEEE